MLYALVIYLISLSSGPTSAVVIAHYTSYTECKEEAAKLSISVEKDIGMFTWVGRQVAFCVPTDK